VLGWRNPVSLQHNMGLHEMGESVPQRSRALP
jgi:hypothetical protein